MGASKSTLHVLIAGPSGTGKTQFVDNLSSSGSSTQKHVVGTNFGQVVYKRTQFYLYEVSGKLNIVAWKKCISTHVYDCIYFFVDKSWTKLQLLDAKNKLMFVCARHCKTPICIVAVWHEHDSCNLLSMENMVKWLQLDTFAQPVWIIQMTHYGPLAVKGVEQLLDWTIRIT